MISFFKDHSKKTGLVLAVAIAMPLTAQYEGLRMRANLDPVGILQICYGETEGVRVGDIKTKKECDDILTARLGYFALVVDNMIEPPISPKTQAALASLTYNIGEGSLKKSKLLRLANEGQMIAACDEMRKWVYAKGKKLPGLVKRREAERQLCLEGLNVRA